MVGSPLPLTYPLWNLIWETLSLSPAGSPSSVLQIVQTSAVLQKMDVFDVPANRQKGWYLSLMAPNTKGPTFAWLDPSRLYCNPQVRSGKTEISRKLVTPTDYMIKSLPFWVLVCSLPRLLQTVWKTSLVHLTATPLTWLLRLMQWDLFLVRKLSSQQSFQMNRTQRGCSWAAA